MQELKQEKTIETAVFHEKNIYIKNEKAKLVSFDSWRGSANTFNADVFTLSKICISVCFLLF